MKFWTLVDIDLKKVLPILGVTFAILTALSVFTLRGSIVGARIEVREMLAASSTITDIIESSGQFTLLQIIDLNHGMLYMWFGFLFLLLIAYLSFYIWYKEWFGQSKRIYMLLTLRVPRFKLILSKLTVLLIAIVIFYGVVMLNLVIGNLMLHAMMPDGLVASGNIREVLANAQFAGLGFFFPMSFVHLIYHLLFATVGFTVITTWVLLNRSKRILGFIAGLIYAIVAATVWIRILMMFLFYDERLLLDWTFVLVVNGLSLLISWYLINKKVTI